MKKIIKDFIELFLLFISFMILLVHVEQTNKKILKELKDLNSTLEYIDKRMDTLEFYRVPEKKI